MFFGYLTRKCQDSLILDFVTLLGVQDYKKVKFSGRDISSLAAKGLKKIDV